MNAIVCDCCGKTVLLDSESRYPYAEPNGINRLTGSILGRQYLDLCDECATKLIAAVKGTEADHGQD